jgi:hypothetical protein
MAISIISATGLTLYGDGFASVFKYDLTDYPISMPLNKTFPDSVVLITGNVFLPDGSGIDTTYTISLSVSKNILTVTFNKPLVAESATDSSGAGLAILSFALVFSSQA